MRIRFVNVGRGKRTWEAVINNGQGIADLEYNIAREAVRNGGLASRGVDALFDQDSISAGAILVGGFRAVGRFEVVGAAPSEHGRDGE